MVAEAAHNHKANHLRILNVTQHCDYADYFILMSATSSRHSCALAESISKDFDVSPRHMEGYPKGEWVLLDLGDVVVHIFHEPIRILYNLDKLWAHVPEVSLASLSSVRRAKTTRSRPHV